MTMAQIAVHKPEEANMRQFLFVACSLASLAAAAAEPSRDAQASGRHAAKGQGEPVAKITATQIVDRNVRARGGLKAWRSVKTMALSGLLEAGGKENPELPFVLKMKREHKSRLEIRFEDQTALQIFNGKEGWKVRPFLGRMEVEPFSPGEAKAAADWQELDGPLIDYVKKGTKVRLQGSEAVEAHAAYKLLLKMKDGTERHVWIDAKTFLEVKADGEPRKLDGRMRNVAIYYRDYKPEAGLVMPHSFETVVEGALHGYKMHIEQVSVNPPMEDALFAKPQAAVVNSSLQH